jgi:hypothetical protein
VRENLVLHNANERKRHFKSNAGTGPAQTFQAPKKKKKKRRHVVIKICNNKYKIKKACDDAIVEPPSQLLFSVAVECGSIMCPPVSKEV